MKINKLKLLSIAICYFVVSLSEAQCADNIQDKVKNDDPIKHHQTGFVPTGSIIAYAGNDTNAYKGQEREWLLCDGEECFSEDYPKLYEIIKTTFVPDTERLAFLKFNESHKGKEKFRIPDLRGRVIVGVDGGAGRITFNNTIGSSGGEERHQLTIAEIPAHTHPLQSCTTPGQRIAWAHGSDNYSNDATGSQGGDQPHNNMQPYQVLNYIINTGKSKKQPELNLHDEKINQLEKQIEELKISQKGCAKAWVTFNGKGPIILENYGVSSVVRNEDGKYSSYTIKFSKPFNSENYCSILTAGNGPTGENCPIVSGPFLEQKRDSFKFYAFSAHTWDISSPFFVSACFYGDQ